MVRRGWGFVLAGLLGAGCGGDAPTAPVESWSIDVVPEATTLAPGSVVFVDVEIRDGTGSPVTRPYALSADDPSVAVIDAAGRLRAVGPGSTMLRATTSGGADSIAVAVHGGPAILALESLDGTTLPLLVDADSVEWNDEREYHEVWVTGGAFGLYGTPEIRYELEVAYEQYRVTEVDGERVLELRARWREYDRGLVSYDVAGDLGMVSELISPLAHRAAPVRGGLVVDFRIPGSDLHMALRYARQGGNI